jgi:hypothetical protein
MKRLALALLVTAGSGSAIAATGSVTLSPAVITLRGSFGQSTKQRLMLTNGSSRPFTFDLVAQDVVARDGHRVFVNAGMIDGSIAATAVFSQTRVTIAPGMSASIDVTFTIPEGSRCRAVAAIFRGTDKIMRGNVPMTASLGTLMTFSLSDNQMIDAGPVVVEAQTRTSNAAVNGTCINNGSEPVVLKGMAAVLDAGGMLVGKMAIRPVRLLPNERAHVHADYPGELAAGHYRVLMTYDVEGKPLTRSGEMDVR